jgi:4-amino-4-deoxy-L-arabinose transferase-like glycosyltransferase
MKLEPFLFFFSHYGFIALIGICAYGIGRRLTRGVHYDSSTEQFSFCTTLGLGSIAYLILLLGALRILHPWSVLVSMGLTCLFCLPVWRELLKRVLGLNWRESLPGQRWLPFLFVALVFSPVLLMPLYPPTAFDSTMYHLAYAKIYCQSHGLVLTPYLRFPVFPQTNEMLFTLALLLYDDVSAQLFQFLMMATLSAGLFALGQRHFSRRSGAWAVVIFLSNPLVLWLGANAYIDMGVALFVTMAAYALLNWIDTKEKKWLVLGGVLLGFAGGSKYSALLFFLLMGLMVFCGGLKGRRFFHAFLFVVVAAGVACPWYFRNWYHTHNPFFPFFGQIFGYGGWNSQDLRGLLDSLTGTSGVGKGLLPLLSLPWGLVFKQYKFLAEAPLSPVYLLALPSLFLSFSDPKRRGLAIIVLAFTLFWFGTAQWLRYLIAIVPLLSLVISVSILKSLKRWPLASSPRVKKRFISVLVLVTVSSPGWLYAAYKIGKQGYPPFTNQQREAYLTRRLPSYPAYQRLNQTRGSDYSVYALFDENMAYFADGRFMGDWFGPGRYEKVYRKLNNPQALHQELRDLNANYFLVRTEKLKTPLPEGSYTRPYFSLIYRKETILLFEVL